MEAGEIPQYALQRELHEELGVEVSLAVHSGVVKSEQRSGNTGPCCALQSWQHSGNTGQ